MSNSVDLKPYGQKDQWWLFPEDAWHYLTVETDMLPYHDLYLLKARYTSGLAGPKALAAFALSKLQEDNVDPRSEVLRVLEFGAKKYSPDNWRRIPDSPKSRREYYSAWCRHVDAAESGEERAEDSNCLHYAHALTGSLMMLWREKFGDWTKSPFYDPEESK